MGCRVFEAVPFSPIQLWRHTINSNQIITLLQESPLFQKVNNSTLSTMLANTTQVRIVAEQILLTPGQLNDSIYIVLSGRLRAQLKADDIKPLALLDVGECVGEISMFDDNHVSAYVIAATDCELLVIKHTEAWSVINRSLQASHNPLALLSHRIRTTNRAVAEWQEDAQIHGMLNYVSPVTGIYNRHWFSKNLGRLIQRHTRNQQPCAAILLRVDNFEQIEAGFGRRGTEQTQRSIAEALQRSLRPNDIEAHIEAEQFVVFLSQTAADGAHVVANRLLEEIDQMVIGISGAEALPPVALSIGISQPQPDDTLDSLITRILPAMRGAQHKVSG